MSDTPETDNIVECGTDRDLVDHAQRLERQRDLYEATARLACENTEDDGDPYFVKMNRRDFDALSAALDAGANDEV